MKTHPSLAFTDPDEQAAYWAARLDGSTLTAADRGALDTWLAADPAHRAALAGYCQLSADLEQQMPLLEGIRDESAETTTALHAARPNPWLRWPVLAGAVLTAAAAVALFFTTGGPPPQRADYATPVAQRAAHNLADGTRVELNARTLLAVDFSAAARRVRLDEGEAFFAVAKDAARPFTVETPAGSVRVTGTQFAVRVEPAGLAVIVAEGSVNALRPNGTMASLIAGDHYVQTADQTQMRRLSAAQLADTLAWREGKAVFRDVALREVVATLARHHGRELTVDEAIADKRIGGTFRLDDIRSFLNLLTQAVEVRIEGDLAHGPLRVVAR
jgi:transmembrane sensor